MEGLQWREHKVAAVLEAAFTAGVVGQTYDPLTATQASPPLLLLSVRMQTHFAEHGQSQS